MSAAAREQLTVAFGVIDALELKLIPFDEVLHAHARRQPGCRVLIDAIYGVGELTAITIVAELGDVRRFANSRDVVRYGGLDITVYQSDDHRAPGHLSRQGPPALRWALYEAAQRARFPASPDCAYYQQLAARIGGNRACPALARKAAQTQLPHPQRPRRPGARADRLTSVTRQAHRSTDDPRPAPSASAADPPRWGRPRKNERPHHLPEHPITHRAADPEPTRAERRSKPGRPRTHPMTSTRARAPILTGGSTGIPAGGRHLTQPASIPQKASTHHQAFDGARRDK
jgi:hypothetical protein